ncbi:MAG: hypothetical protein COA41_00380 [Sphingopyxis sp.]|nr:MAG: hypothetical protein COA41_00380 [Sphingopyxis sp.]
MRTPCCIDKGLHHVVNDMDCLFLLRIAHAFNTGNDLAVSIKFSRSNIHNHIHHITITALLNMSSVKVILPNYVG